MNANQYLDPNVPVPEENEHANNGASISIA